MHLLTGYAKPITALAFSPDGSRLFSAAQGQQRVWEWDLSEKTLRRKLTTGFGRHGVEALAVTPAGDFLLAAQPTGGAAVLPLQGEEARASGPWAQAQTSSSPALAVHPGGRLLAAPLQRWGPGYGYQVWDLESGEQVTEQTGHKGRVCDIAFAPAGGVLATASADGTVRLWVYPGGEAGHVLSHEVIPKALSFRPDGRVLASAGGRSVFVWDVAGGQLLHKLTGQGGTVTALAYSPDGKYLTSIGHDGAVFLRDAQTHEVVGRRNLDIGKLGALAWRADSSGLAVGGQKLIALCGVEELLVREPARRRAGSEPLSLAGHYHKVEALAYSRDGQLLASGSRWAVRLWDLSGGAGQARERLAFSPGGTPGLLSWSPDGSRLALSFQDAASIIDAATGATVRSLDPRKGFPRHLSFTPSDRLLLLVGDDWYTSSRLRLSLRDPDADNVLFEATVQERVRSFVARCAVFGDPEQRIYLAPGGSTVSRWDVAAGTVAPVILQMKSRIAEFAVRPDEKQVVTLGGNTAHVWELPSGKRRLELKHPLIASGAAFLPGERLLTSCYDGVVRVWDLSGGTELHSWDLGMGKIYSLAVAPDHMTFAAGVEKKSRIVLMDVPD